MLGGVGTAILAECVNAPKVAEVAVTAEVAVADDTPTHTPP